MPFALYRPPPPPILTPPDEKTQPPVLAHLGASDQMNCRDHHDRVKSPDTSGTWSAAKYVMTAGPSGGVSQATSSKAKASASLVTRDGGLIPFLAGGSDDFERSHLRDSSERANACHGRDCVVVEEKLEEPGLRK